MGSILAEEDPAYACACFANFIANVLLYVTELQVLQVLKWSPARHGIAHPLESKERKVWAVQEMSDLGVKHQDQTLLLVRVQGTEARMSRRSCLDELCACSVG